MLVGMLRKRLGQQIEAIHRQCYDSNRIALGAFVNIPVAPIVHKSPKMGQQEYFVDS